MLFVLHKLKRRAIVKELRIFIGAVEKWNDDFSLKVIFLIDDWRRNQIRRLEIISTYPKGWINHLHQTVSNSLYHMWRKTKEKENAGLFMPNFRMQIVRKNFLFLFLLMDVKKNHENFWFLKHFWCYEKNVNLFSFRNKFP